jgi:serine/threonine-protein kinase
MTLIGGHPRLVRQAFDYLQDKAISWEEFLQIATTESSPFSNSLRQQLWTLQQQPDLALAFSEVLKSEQPISLPCDRGFKLQSMGLVNLDGDKYYPKYNLYHQYFSVHLNH